MPSGDGTGAKDVAAYLARLPPKDRRALGQLRRLIRSVAPRAEEVISYRMPGFRQDGMLVWYAGFRDHLSFFIGSVVTARRFARELRPFDVGKGTAHFSADEPLPAALVTRIVRARLAENAARRRARAGRPADRKPRRRATPRAAKRMLLARAP